MNRELPDVQTGFRKDRGTRDQIANIHWIIEKAREFQENIYFYFIDYTKAFDCVDQNSVQLLSRVRLFATLWTAAHQASLSITKINHGKFLKKWEYQTTLPTSWEICMKVKKQQLEPDMEQWTGSKLWKEYITAVCCHPA